MPDEPRSDAQVARQAAIEQAVSTLAYFAVMTAISVAILKRYQLAAVWRRVRHRPVSAEEARARRLTADLRRDLSRIEHGDKPSPCGCGGLYEVP